VGSVTLNHLRIRSYNTTGKTNMKIAVLHDYADVFRGTRAYPRLKAHEVVIYTDAYTDPARVIEQAAGCDALLITQQRVTLTREIIEHLPDLRFISQTGRNTSHLDVAACTQHGIVVSAGGSSGGGSPYSTTAELTWGLILASLRHLPYEVERLKQGHWHTTVGTRLFGRTLGVYAFGHIGAAVARVGKAFGMHVVCWGREGSTARAKAEGFEIAASQDAFFENADVISLHLPSNTETRGIVTADDLARMKPSALLVNTSRAPIIAEGALVDALQQGRPGFAAVDVYEEEPVVGAHHPLLQMSNVLCTPHLGYAEQGGYEALYTLAVDQLLAFAEGQPINVVNPEAVRRSHA
jgi:D-3-phosphoglycerate dehydrogenase